MSCSDASSQTLHLGSAKSPLELCTGKVQSKVHSSMFGATVLAELPEVARLL